MAFVCENMFHEIFLFFQFWNNLVTQNFPSGLCNTNSVTIHSIIMSGKIITYSSILLSQSQNYIQKVFPVCNRTQTIIQTHRSK